MDVRTIFNSKKARHGISFNAKDEQINTAKSVLEGRNVLALLPTGYGKTLCFIIPTIVNSDANPITLVISPLSALIDDQILGMSEWGLSAVKLEPLADMSNDAIKDLKCGHYNFVFSSPETALKPYWKDVFMSKKWQDNAILLCIDEAHCISEWGENFRRDFQQLHELRSIFKTPVMALTATSTLSVKSDIMQYLHIQDADIVFKLPDRENIFIDFVKSVSSDLSDKLECLSDHIMKNGVSSKKTIVYCRSIDKVSEVFVHLKHVLGLNAYVEGIKDADHLIVEMFHSCTHEHSKKRILKNFKDPDGNLRCLIATVALGMGIQINDVDLIIHIGCPKTVISYWQEAGRCARDGRPGYSYVLYDNITISQKNTDEKMAEIARNVENACLRKFVLQNFDIEQSISNNDTTVCKGCDDERCQCPSCICCSVCITKCPCNMRIKFTLNKFMEMNDGPTDDLNI